MQDRRYPPIEPFQSGLLRVPDGNAIHWETSGNPLGKPVIYLHGGPGGGVGQGYRRHFDPAAYLIVSFDQRGCGRSRPRAVDGGLASNTTQAIIADMEALRQYLNIDSWMITGASWGTALGLAYAQAHPDRVTELVLALIHIPSAFTVGWITETMRHVLPQEWSEYEKAAHRMPGEPLVEAYARMLADPDSDVREAAALAWCRWEDAHMSLDPNATSNLSGQCADWQVNFATLVTHYWRHAGFLAGADLLENMPRITHLPGVLIHGRLDISSPLEMAWELHRRWRGSELIVIPDEGHGGPRMLEEIDRAAARFAGR